MNSPSLSHLLAVFLAIGAMSSAHAQNQLAYSYSFNGFNGDEPDAGVTLVGDTLYGTTDWGGLDGGGSVFSMPLDGGTPSFVTSLDDDHTVSQLFAVGDTLYGTTYSGVGAPNGGIFALSTDDGGITRWIPFALGSGGPSNPEGNLTLVGNNLYGTTENGTIYSVDVTGTTSTYTVRASLPGSAQAGLTLNSNGTVFYGVTSDGGAHDDGALFSMPVNGTTATTLFSFNGTNGDAPAANLLLVGNNVYGTTPFGGANGKGTVFSFSLTTNTQNWLYSFQGSQDQPFPSGGLTLYGNNLYGVTSAGGTYGDGTIFSISLDGGTMTTLYSFTGGADGDDPSGNLLLVGNTLYGTTSFGGTESAGTVFAFNLSSVPEPSTWALLLGGGFGLLAFRLTQRTRSQGNVAKITAILPALVLPGCLQHSTIVTGPPIGRVHRVD